MVQLRAITQEIWNAKLSVLPQLLGFPYGGTNLFGTNLFSAYIDSASRSQEQLVQARHLMHAKGSFAKARPWGPRPAGGQPQWHTAPPPAFTSVRGAAAECPRVFMGFPWVNAERKRQRVWGLFQGASTQTPMRFRPSHPRYPL